MKGVDTEEPPKQFQGILLPIQKGTAHGTKYVRLQQLNINLQRAGQANYRAQLWVSLLG